MSKLLSAGFIRLRKDKIFWIALIFMFGAGVFFPVMRYIDMQKSGYINNIDNGFFACALFIGVVMAVFCSLFIGTEYSDGTIRNKSSHWSKENFHLFIKFDHLRSRERCHVCSIFLLLIFA